MFLATLSDQTMDGSVNRHSIDRREALERGVILRG